MKVTWIDVVSFLIDFIVSPRGRIVKFDGSVVFFGSDGIFRYGPPQ